LFTIFEYLYNLYFYTSRKYLTRFVFREKIVYRFRLGIDAQHHKIGSILQGYYFSKAPTSTGGLSEIQKKTLHLEQNVKCLQKKQLLVHRF